MIGAAAAYGTPWKLSRRDLMIFAVLGIANQAAYLGLSYVGIRSISSGLAALVISANPVLTAVMAAAFLDERMTWRKAAGLLLGVGGVAFVVEGRLAGGVDHPVGIAFMIAALVSLVGRNHPVQEARTHGRALGRQRRAKPLGRPRNAAVRLHLRKRRRHRAELAPVRGARLSGPAGLGVRLSALVPSAHRLRCNRGEFLSLHDAAAGHGCSAGCCSESMSRSPILSASYRSRSAFISSRVRRHRDARHDAESPGVHI